MGDYTDIQLINCNRAASVEARSRNDSNPAVWSNTLQQTVRLNVGDTISVERAFVSEVGAGNSNTIEFKGVSTGINKLPPYTDIQYVSENRVPSRSLGAGVVDPLYRLGYYRGIKTVVETDKTTPLRDNEAPVIIGYYFTACEYPNYIPQPRRFSQEEKTTNPVTDPQDVYTTVDGSLSGAAFFTVNENMICNYDWRKHATVGAQHNGQTYMYKQRIRNERYTMFVKNSAVYVKNTDIWNSGESDMNFTVQYPTVNVFGHICEATYHRIRERVDLSITKGFNTPTAVAQQLTKQLNETETPLSFEAFDDTDYLHTLTHTVSSKTYKPINCQNRFQNSKTKFDEYSQQVIPSLYANTDQTSIDYISSYAFIAIKRPEIYETGMLLQQQVPSTGDVYQKIYPAIIATKILSVEPHSFRGFQVLDLVREEGLVNTYAYMDTNIRYTKENLSLLRDFFDAQALYPELWDDVELTENYDPARSTRPTEAVKYETSRFLHINQYPSAGSPGTLYNEEFGSDNMTANTFGPGGNGRTKTSNALFIDWDESQRDNYIEVEEPIGPGSTRYSYGFAQPIKFSHQTDSAGTPIVEYFIRIRPDRAGGIPMNLFVFGDIERGRRLGFDSHSTAYSTCMICPYSGYTTSDAGTLYDTGATQKSIAQNTTVINNTGDQTTGFDINQYITQTYMGANTPIIDFNGVNNRFEFSKFHTANNSNNSFYAGTSQATITSDALTKPVGEVKTINKPEIDPNAGDTVYKINPRPPDFGYSPAFKPYVRKDQRLTNLAYPDSPGGSAVNHENLANFPADNVNIEPFEIFDSHGGIYIDDFGYSENDWSQGMWDILGFNYNQVSAKPSNLNVLNQRINNDNIAELYRLTTNAEVVASDNKAYVLNDFGAAMYSTSLPFVKGLTNLISTGTDPNSIWSYDTTPITYYPESIIRTQSISVPAGSLSKAVLKPYYTVRSSILEGSTAIGGNPSGANLPIISIIDKYSAQNDYFLGNPSSLVFTVTKPQMISDIITSICDSDGTYANINNTSAVIYKIERAKRTPEGIIAQILAEGEKQSKKK
tara:strand:+ start:1449 stop:4622 length:3174 start_codon:yes stop_codon:yes gene_type:complete